jgi:hypothetical protein
MECAVHARGACAAGVSGTVLQASCVACHRRMSRRTDLRRSSRACGGLHVPARRASRRSWHAGPTGEFPGEVGPPRERNRRCRNAHQPARDEGRHGVRPPGRHRRIATEPKANKDKRNFTAFTDGCLPVKRAARPSEAFGNGGEGAPGSDRRPVSGGTFSYSAQHPLQIMCINSDA